MTAARARPFALIAVALALLILPAFGRERAAQAASASPAGVGALRICSNCTATGGNLSRYDYVILNSWDAPLIPALKAANPGLKALVYKNLSFTASYSCSRGVDKAHLSTGVGYCDASASHPFWFLTDTGGHRINSAYFRQAWLMDVGNSAYQSRWLSDVKADLRAGGWDGVFADDTDASIAWHLEGRTIARYPSDAAWRKATRSMLARVGPALRSSGFLVVPNIYAPWAADYDAQATWRDWIQFTSGAAQEYYTKWGTGSSGWFAKRDWTYRQQFQVITERAGKMFFGVTYAPRGDTRSMQYARANFLLFHDPANGGALVYEPSDPEAQSPYASQLATRVGEPLGSRFRVGAAWRRNFTGGAVIVNPTSSRVNVRLGRPYVRDDGVVVRVLRLGPTSGAVLRSTGAQPPPGATGTNGAVRR